MTWITPALLTLACGLLLICIGLFICYWRMAPQPAQLDTVLDLMDSVQRLREARVLEEARRSEFSSFLTPSSPLCPPCSHVPDQGLPTSNPPQMRRPFLFSPRLPLKDSRVMKLARTRGMTDLRDPHLVSEPIPLRDFPPMARPAPYLRSPLSVEVAGGYPEDAGTASGGGGALGDGGAPGGQAPFPSLPELRFGDGGPDGLAHKDALPSGNGTGSPAIERLGSTPNVLVS